MKEWWFVDPEGYLFWSQGVTGVGSGSFTETTNREQLFPPFIQDKASPDWSFLKEFIKKDRIDFYTLNIKRKYGKDWENKHASVTAGRLKSWGMNTYGAWSKPPSAKKHLYTLIIHPERQGIGSIAKMVDPFSEAFKSDLKEKLNRLQKHKTDPWLLGVYVNNELHWRNEMDVPNELLKLKNKIPARKEMEEFLLKKYKTIEKLNLSWNIEFDSFETINGNSNQQFSDNFKEDLVSYFYYFAETYFKTVAQELKKVLPNHLYLGSRFHDKAKYNKTLQKAASKYCDVISFNIYDYLVKDFELYTEIDKPAIIGEFHFGTGTHGVWGTGLRSAYDLDNQAELYEQYIKEAASHPSFIGAHWFQWSDQPTTGRFGDGENFRIGLVNITDQPYELFIAAINEAAQDLYKNRME